jgi:hypothetical protein
MKRLKAGKEHTSNKFDPEITFLRPQQLSQARNPFLILSIRKRCPRLSILGVIWTTTEIQRAYRARSMPDTWLCLGDLQYDSTPETIKASAR